MGGPGPPARAPAAPVVPDTALIWPAPIPAIRDLQDRTQELERLEKNLRANHEKLLRLDKRNRSILFKKVYTKHNFDLAELGEASDRILGSVFRNRSSVNILRDSEEGEDADDRRGRLRKLAGNLAQIEEETGQQTGYLGFPFVQGHANADFYVRGPLVLFPVSLERRRQARNGGWHLNLLRSPPVYNGALVSAIKKMAEIDVPDDIEERFDDLAESMDDYEGDDAPAEFLRRISKWALDVLGVREPCPLGCAPVPPLRKDDIQVMDRRPLSLVDHRVIGSFPQADNEIYADYVDLLGSLGSLDLGPMGDLLDIHDPDADEDPPDRAEVDLDRVPDTELNTVLDSDSSQDEVILESKRSGLVLVRGPPGTGKSQVITNMIADALSNGRRVLVVCQKRAALDVVRQRLAKVGLDRFAVMLDKESSDRRAMYEQLLGIMQDPGGLPEGHARSPQEISGMIDKRVARLAELGRALHREYFGGVTAHRIYSELDSRYVPRLGLRAPGLGLEWGGLGTFLETIARLAPSYARFDAPGRPWAGRVDFSELTNARGSEITGLLGDLSSRLGGAEMAPSRESQDELVGHLDTYLNNPGFLKMRRKKAARAISAMLGRDVGEAEAAAMLPRAKAGSEAWGLLGSLLPLFGDAARGRITGAAGSGDLAGVVAGLESSMADFDSMRAYDLEKREAGAAAGKMLGLCAARMDPGADWAASLRSEILSAWLDEIEGDNPVLRLDHAEVYRENSEALARLYGEKREALLGSIRASIAGSVTGRDLRGRADTPEKKAWKELGKELKRKRKVKPVRQLFGAYPSQFLQLAPCWLASPESVSKVFPLTRRLFDLVIVDEASQLPVERALPFLYRAGSVVIAGDEKQLQPFDLFQVVEEDDEEDEDVLDEKSLLDMARALHDPIQLAWHYRSRYQDLINFSNHAFYGGTLQIAPNVSKDPEHPPIRWVKCGGVWDGRRNHAEAEKVLEVIRGIWESVPDASRSPSIGVITFNDSQRDLVSEQFDRRLDKDPDFYRLYTSATEGRGIDDMPFFKNIENVQGDERDVIIFSVGYARDPDGKFSNRFGTLAKAGGENRLNVAITRARQAMVVVCSIDPGDIKETSKNEGPRLLRQFLEYSRATSESNSDGVQDVIQRLGDATSVRGHHGGSTESPFEDQVKAALERRGYEVRPQVGFSGYRIDLGIVHPDDPNRFVVGLECDGATFHSARSAKERDVMRQRFLEGKGWVIERIWSRRWWRDPGAEIDRIAARIEELRGQAVT